MDYPWPGNIRELENTLHNAVLLSKEEEITPAQLRLSTLHDTPATATDNELDSFIYQQLNQPGEALWERITGALIRGAMAHCDDNQSQAAALLGISRHTLRTQLANIGLIKSRRRVETTPRPLSGTVSADRERIGYQRFGNLGILKARQSLESAFAHLGVSVLWSEFPAGPQLLHALACNEIDFGTTGEAPPVFAQSSNSELVYVAWEPPAPQSVAMVVPQHSAIRTIADLRGKRIALNKGSNVHWLLLQILEEAGLGLNDVRIVYTPQIPADRQRLSGGGCLDDVGSAVKRRRTHRGVTGGGQRRRSGAKPSVLPVAPRLRDASRRYHAAPAARADANRAVYRSTAG
jgi:DNA-binding protein Fis